MFPKKGQLDEERFKKAMQAKEFFMAFYNANCDKISIENPIPMKIIGLPPVHKPYSRMNTDIRLQRKLIFG